MKSMVRILLGTMVLMAPAFAVALDPPPPPLSCVPPSFLPTTPPTQCQIDLTTNPSAFLDDCNAAADLVIPTVLPIIFQDISATASDATLVLRLTTLVTNAWYDATAPYHPTAVGVYSSLGRKPAPSDNRDMNIALLHASYRVLNSLLPARAAVWDGMLATVGLFPVDNTVDTDTPEGLGNVAGNAIVVGRENDGMNQLGFADGRTYNPVPYMDYTGYAPVNTPHEVTNASRWQPDIQRKGIGLYKGQEFVTPQYALVEPYSYDDPQALGFGVPPPSLSCHHHKATYKAQADEVLAASANLNTERKLKAELFDNKLAALGFSVLSASLQAGHSLLEFIQLDFLTNMAAFDAGIFIWQEKREFDAVRPFTAISHIYGDDPVTAWGGPGVGTVNLPASEWKSYLEEADHPEYPSASTCFCAAHAQAARSYLGTNNLNFGLVCPPGGSLIEPGVTPPGPAPTFLNFATWDDFVDDCGQSRVSAGVHFQDAVDQSRVVCDQFGTMAKAYLDTLIDGTAASPRPPSVGRPMSTLSEPHLGKGACSK